MPGKGRYATKPKIVEEVAIATVEAITHSSNDIGNGNSVAQALNIPWTTVHVILHKILKLYPYKMHFMQQLKLQDHCAHLKIALSFLVRK